jgi:hypothetical protein
VTKPNIGVTLLIDIHLLMTEEGGRTCSVRSGYRPICIIPRPDCADALIGLCELQLVEEIPPGRTGEGRLAFATDVADEVRSLVSVGSRFTLAEGHASNRHC